MLIASIESVHTYMHTGAVNAGKDKVPKATDGMVMHVAKSR